MITDAPRKWDFMTQSDQSLIDQLHMLQKCSKGDIAIGIAMAIEHVKNYQDFNMGEPLPRYSAEALGAEGVQPPSPTTPELTTEEQLGFLADDIMKMLADHVYNCKTPLRTKLCLLMRPYVAEPTGPVSASIDKCLEYVRMFCREAHSQNDEVFARNLCKAVLKAAGVKYA